MRDLINLIENLSKPDIEAVLKRLGTEISKYLATKLVC